jgi:alkylated DNA repair dioxygenase AlkB
LSIEAGMLMRWHVRYTAYRNSLSAGIPTMREQSLFSFDEPDGHPELIEIPDAALTIYHHAFSDEEANHYLKALMTNTPWRHDDIQIHGKLIPLPRLQQWYCDEYTVLRYSGMSLQPLRWTDELLSIRAHLKRLTDLSFNGVLVNCYRNGNDSVGWHRDNELQFGKNPVIASVSFGAARDFVLKHLYKAHEQPIKCSLSHGSLLIMGDTVQNYWKHQLPKRKDVALPRINLTFRNIVA